MDQNSGFSITEAMRLAQTLAGRQLIDMIQQQNNNALQEAIAHATAGDYQQAQKLLAPMLQSPEIQALLKQMGG